MTVVTQEQAVAVATRVMGRDDALRLCADLPDQLDSENERDLETLRRIGLTREQVFDDLGAEL